MAGKSEHVPLDLTSGTDLTLEHQVEFLRLRQLISGFRVDNVVLLDDVSKFGTSVVVDLQRVCVFSNDADSNGLRYALGPTRIRTP